MQSTPSRPASFYQRSRNFFLATAFGTLASLSTATPAAAQSVWTAGHGDLSAEFDDSTASFHAHWHLDSGSIVNGTPLSTSEEYHAEDLIAYGTLQSTIPHAAVAAALGVAPSSTAFRLGSSSYPPNLGISLHGVGHDDDWLDGSITLTLTSTAGPGRVALASRLDGIVFMDSDGGFYEFLLEPHDDHGHGGHGHEGPHIHLDWWFSHAGVYDLTFTWSGTYLGGSEPTNVSYSETFQIEVAAIPEPGTWALLGAGAIGLLIFRRRRQAA